MLRFSDKNSLKSAADAEASVFAGMTNFDLMVVTEET